MIPASAVRFGTEPTAPPSRIESMTLDVVVRFLSEVVRSLFGTGIWCAVMQIAHAAFGVAPMPFVIRDVHVVATPDGFAAAWINEVNGNRIGATEVDARGHGGTVV